MATHDYVIANGTGAAVRSDLNDALAAIVSNNSSSSEPATTYAYQWWADTTANVLKIRNGANNAWITLRELDGTMLIEDGTASLPGLAFADDTNTGIFSGGADEINISTGGTERVVVDSSGRVGIGATSPGRLLTLYDSGNNGMLSFTGGTSSVQQILFGDTASETRGKIAYSHTDDSLAFTVADSERMRLDSSGRLGIGTTSPDGELHVSKSVGSSTGEAGIRLDAVGSILSARSEIRSGVTNGGDPYFSIAARDTGGSILERMRIDSSGRLLVGTSSARSNFYNLSLEAGIQVENIGSAKRGASIVTNSTSNDPATFIIAKSNGGTIGSNTLVGNNTWVGNISFQGNDGTDFVQLADINAFVDGTPGSNNMPGRLEFSTTRSTESSPTERMRVAHDGRVTFKREGYSGNPGYTHPGVAINDVVSGTLNLCRDGNGPLYINRLSNDGVLVNFAQDTAVEGSISVSGSTVSYNGGHLARWSQLASGAERTEILRGSVLSNLDEMCEWAYEAQDAVLYTEDDELPEGVSVGDVKEPARAAGTEDNEQLNRMKVSDVEGDRNVAGVFQGWDDDDDTYTNDFYCAMTGDFVIRIAQGTTVARGDLLMSAGDGTAKPQDDDIVRSKTIAKVTSTTVSTTYSDGSYCVPCVLMAC